MIKNTLIKTYKQLRLEHYRQLFKGIREKPGSLSATEAYSVDAIYILNKPTIKQFSDWLNISQPNATYKINSLVQKGYIRRLPSDADKRECLLEVTDKFHGYYDSYEVLLSEAAEELQKKYSKEELELFTEMLGVVEETIKKG